MANEKRIEDLIAENIAFYRKANGITQSELAEKLNYSDKLISKWERAEGMPDVIVLKAVADLFHISVNDFYREEKRKTPVSKNVKKWYVVALSATLLWVIATTVFVTLALALPNQFPWWLIFIYSFTGTGIVCVVWGGIYHNKLFQLISTSIIIWGVVLSVYLTLNFTTKLNQLWLVFVVGIPLECLAVLWFLLRNGSKKKKQMKKAENE